MRYIIYYLTVVVTLLLVPVGKSFTDEWELLEYPSGQRVRLLAVSYCH